MKGNITNINSRIDDKILTQLHNIELDIMDEIHRICTDNNITYYLAGGSVLGAIRHKGFIPWDDDIDICMPRKDFEKFVEVCQEQLQTNFFLQTEQTDQFYGKFIAKVIKKGTIFQEEIAGSRKAYNGIFVDVFVLDDIKHRKGKQKIFTKIIWFLTDILSIKRGWSISRKKAYALLSFLLKENFILKLRYKFLTWDMKKKCAFYVNYGSQYGVVKQTFPKSVFGIPKLSKFENRQYYIPQQAKKFLKQLYGADYMKLPPMEKRVCHNPVKIDFGNLV